MGMERLFFFLVWATSFTTVFILASESMKTNLYLETAPLFRSQVSKYYDIPEDFTVKIKEFVRNMAEKEHFETKLTQSPHVVHPARSFIVKTTNHCDHICHQTLASHFGNHRYEIISAEVGLVTTTFQQLRSFKEETTVNPVITDYAPLYPEMKISPEVRELITSATTTDCSISSNQPLRLMFALHGLSQSEFDHLSEVLRGLVSQYQPQLRVHWSFGSSNEFIANEKCRGFVVLHDCHAIAPAVTFLSEQPEIYWIERDYPIIFHNRWANGVCDSGEAEVTPLDDHNLSGQGEVIAISDTGIDMTHCFFADANHSPPYDTINLNHRKVVQYITAYGDQYDSTEGHGSHVAGTAAGSLSSSDSSSNEDMERFEGMASGAKIAFADLMTGDDTSGNLNVPSVGLSVMFTNLAASGARIFTNSWGTVSNSYNAVAQEVDTYMRSNPDTLILFSAGNNGQSGFNTVGSPATNKNGIAVGATLNDRESWKYSTGAKNPASYLDESSVAYFSSRGPTADQRLKPDILAPGWYVYSANGNYQSTGSHCDLTGKAGTSMSAPVMAGFAAKIRQYYRKGYYPTGKASPSDGFTPSGALLKATLVHSGQRMTALVSATQTATSLSTYPSTIQGYGRIELKEVLHFGQSTTRPITMFVIGGATAADGHYEELLLTGDTTQYTFGTNSSTNQPAIRITLAYTDVAGSFSAVDPLINSLSVSVSSSVGGGGSSSFTPYLVSGTRKSNLQVIDIASPTPSTNYTVTITADRILQSPQPYALVITGQLTYLNSTSTGGSDSDSSNALDLQSLLVYIIVPIVIAVVAVVLWLVWSCCCSRRGSYAPTARQEPRHHQQQLHYNHQHELPVAVQATVVQNF